jgi:hypothetical protein
VSSPNALDILTVIALLAAVGAFIFAIWMIGWREQRTEEILNKWAQDNGYVILEQKHEFWNGPFFWSTSKGQEVYYVTVRDKADVIRSGWVRLGGYWWGLSEDKAEVRWDEKAKNDEKPKNSA